MTETKPNIEDCKVAADMHHRRLMSLLQELVREEGIMKAAQVLEVSYRMVASTMKTSSLSQKMRWALERLLYGQGAVAMEHWESSARLKDRFDKLEETIGCDLEELRTELEGQRQELVKQLEDHARYRRRVENQLAALVLGHAVAATESTSVEEDGADGSGVSGTSSGPSWWRPSESTQRKVMALFHEWWLARNSLLAAEEQVNIAMGWGSFADLALRDESAEARARHGTRRTPQRSKRNLTSTQLDESTRATLG